MLFEQARRRTRQSFTGAHVHAEQLALGPRRDARRTSDQAFAAGRPCERYDYPLARLPRVGDPVVLHISLQAFVHLVGNPEQRELSQRREVAGPEVVRERRVDLLRLVDVAVSHTPAQRLGGAVDQLDLVGSPHDLVGERLALLHTGDALDDVVHRLEVLDIDGGHDVDACIEKLLDVLPALLVARTRNVRMRELVDEGERRPAPEHGVDVHLLERTSPIWDHPPGHDLEVADLLDRPGPAVRLDESDHDVGPPVVTASTLVQHREGLADARRGAEVHAKTTASHAST